MICFLNDRTTQIFPVLKSPPKVEYYTLQAPSSEGLCYERMFQAGKWEPQVHRHGCFEYWEVITNSDSSKQKF